MFEKALIFLKLLASFGGPPPSPESRLYSEDFDYCIKNDTFYTPSSNTYLLNILSPITNPLLGNIFDGPTSFSSAKTRTTVTVKDFTVPELMFYNYIAASTYCPYTLPDLTCCYCQHFRDTVTEFKVFEEERNGTKALVTLHKDRKEIVVAFRGSVALMNWLMDIYMVSADFQGRIKIHRGIYLQTMSLYNQITQYLATLLENNPGFKITFTGHSLGGGMASTFVFFLNYLNQFPGTEYGLVPLGSPRVGNMGFADYMNSLDIKMARVVARADLVPHTPPAKVLGLNLLLPSYVHHMREVWINGNETIFCSKEKYEDPNCSNSLGPLYSIVDHNGYFDVDMGRCIFVEGYIYADLLTLPNGWKPTNYLPPMPEFMYKTLLGVWAGGYQGLSTLVG